MRYVLFPRSDPVSRFYDGRNGSLKQPIEYFKTTVFQPQNYQYFESQ